ncbi:hypothetical protein F5Y18DRAFT_434959 [Xylariaceae sp. FL1019]|nr:hypothetical protein F5Y18DRAFT_434959 [Xylariaceae sp. FL1019]
MYVTNIRAVALFSTGLIMSTMVVGEPIPTVKAPTPLEERQDDNVCCLPPSCRYCNPFVSCLAKDCGDYFYNDCCATSKKEAADGTFEYYNDAFEKITFIDPTLQTTQ